MEAKDGGSCIVRLVNSGFGEGGEWDDQYDGMVEGWQLFLFNLQLHCRHFLGRDAVSMLPMGESPKPRAEAWSALCADLGIPEAPAVEPGGEGCGVSIWSYLYGPDATATIERDKPRWQTWLTSRGG